VASAAVWGTMVAINIAKANVATAGDLIKSDSSPAVYYLDSNLVKHPFHHEREYVTWYPDFNSLKTVPTDEMVSYTLGSTVVVRQGTKLIQYVEVLGDGTWNVSNTPEVYAVGPNGATHAIDSADTAALLYGANWESMIIPLPNYLAANYSSSAPLTSSSTYPTGTLVQEGYHSPQIYYIEGSTKRLVTNAGMIANRLFSSTIVVPDLSIYTDGVPITVLENEIAYPMGDGGFDCTNECNLYDTQCSGEGYQTCGDYDGNGCTEWGEISNCLYSCQDGNCTLDPPQCFDECSINETQCSGEGYQACGDYNGDGCTEWGETQSCQEHFECNQGQCNLLSAGTHLITIEFDDQMTNFTGNTTVERSYYIHLPTNFNPNLHYDVLFWYHGKGGTAQQQLSHQFDEIADQQGNFIVVYPQGMGRSNNQLVDNRFTNDAQIGLTCWNTRPGQEPIDDRGCYAQMRMPDDDSFIDIIVNNLESSFYIDKIFAGGFSYGCAQAQHMALTRNDIIAMAVGGCGGPGSDFLAYDTAIAAGQKDAIPIIRFHSTNDQTSIYLYEGESPAPGEMPTAEVASNYYADAHQCTSVEKNLDISTPSVQALINSSPVTSVDYWVHQSCLVPTEFYKLEDGEHVFYQPLGSMMLEFLNRFSN